MSHAFIAGYMHKQAEDRGDPPWGKPPPFSPFLSNRPLVPHPKVDPKPIEYHSAVSREGLPTEADADPFEVRLARDDRRRTALEKLYQHTGMLPGPALHTVPKEQQPGKRINKYLDARFVQEDDATRRFMKRYRSMPQRIRRGARKLRDKLR